ncbi:MAG: VTT domain-containing protein [Actinomycetota bacterium]|nr:VTT domain-containing protein [Actinomycetota bacterium]
MTAAVGQMIGKVVFYYAGRGMPMLPARLRHEPGRQRARRWASQLQRFQEFSQQRRMWTAGMLLTSALTGLPPFAATSVLAGLARVQLMTFLVAGLIGRFARFSAVAAFPSLLTTWWL